MDRTQNIPLLRSWGSNPASLLQTFHPYGIRCSSQNSSQENKKFQACYISSQRNSVLASKFFARNKEVAGLMHEELLGLVSALKTNGPLDDCDAACETNTEL